MKHYSISMLVLAALVVAACSSDRISSPTGSSVDAAKGSPANPAIAIRLRTPRQGNQWWALAVMDADGTHRTNVYTVPTVSSQFGSFSGPSWSPNGGSISFVEHTGTQSGVTRLKRINVTLVNGVPVGSPATTLLEYNTPATANIRDQDWSPSPLVSEIAYVSATVDPNTTGAGPLSSYSVQVVSTNGGQPTTVYTSPMGHLSSYLSWNPSGTELAVVDFDNATGFCRILVIDRATGAVLRTVADGMYTSIGGLDWSNDGNTLVYSAFASGSSSQLYTIDALGNGEPVQRINGARPSWSSDNGSIAYNSTNDTVKSLNLATGATRPLYGTMGGSAIGYADWKR